MRRVVATLLLTGLFAMTRTAAAEAPPVSLDLSECERLDEASVRRIFAADLGTRVATEPNPYITEVNIGCEGKRVIVRVRDPLSRKTVRRSFDSTSFGDRGEARLVAIAASELVMASWAELAANPAPEVEPEGPAPTAQTVETARAAVRAHRSPSKAAASSSARPVQTLDGPAGAPSTTDSESAKAAADASLEPDAVITAVPSELGRSPHQRKDPRRVDAPVLRIVALASARAFLNGSGQLYGGGARVGEERFTVASWAVDALIESGTLESSKVTSTTIGGMLQMFLQHEPLTWRAGVGLRAGLLSSDDGTYLGSFGWPLATTSLSLFTRQFVFDLGAELGYGILPLSGAASPSVRGIWASAQAGIGVAF